MEEFHGISKIRSTFIAVLRTTDNTIFQAFNHHSTMHIEAALYADADGGFKLTA